jgi:hypothetical protein
MSDPSTGADARADARSTPGDLRCYACGHEYDHLGAPPHPGRCPVCEARAASPAGRLASLGPAEAVVAGPGEATHRVDAEDASGRTFSYWLTALDGGRAQLVRVGVVDAIVGPRHDAWPDGLPDLVPGWIAEAVAGADLELVAPVTVLE